MQSVKILPFILVCFFAVTLWSKEKVEAVSADYSGNQSQEWNAVLTGLQALKGKVDAQENLVKNLMGEKTKLSGAALTEHLKLIKTEHKKWQTLIADFNKLNLEYETKFPEKGAQAGRKYRRLDQQTFEATDREVTYDTQVDRLQNKIFQQYPKSGKILAQEREKKKKDDEKKRKAKILQPKKLKPDATESVLVSGDVTAPIILKK